MSDIKNLAEGGPFDTTTAIRTLAKELYLLQINMADHTPTVTAAEGPTLVTLLNGKLAATLANAGYADIESVRLATDEQLLAVPGITDKALKLIREKLA